MLSEKDFEDIICRYPELIEEELILKGRQISLYGKRIDIFFHDKFGQNLIVELKVGPIAREHIGQVMEYEGGILSEEDPTARVMLVGSRVPPNFKKALNHHGIEWREISLSHLKEFLKDKNDEEFLNLLGEGSIIKKNTIQKEAIKITDRVFPKEQTEAILFSADPKLVNVDTAINHLKRERQLYWEVGFSIKKENFVFPLIGYLYIKGESVKYKLVIDDIIPHDPQHYLASDAIKTKPQEWIDGYKENPNDGRPWKTAFVISRIEELPHSIDVTKIKKVDGQFVSWPPQNYIRILDCELRSIPCDIKREIKVTESYRNVFITVSEDCPVEKGIVPDSKDEIAYIGYDELSNNPYKYTELEFFRQVHHIRRGRPELKIETYMIRRNILCQKYGWGVHVNELGRLALVGCETEKYKELLNNHSIDKVPCFRKYKV